MEKKQAPKKIKLAEKKRVVTEKHEFTYAEGEDEIPKIYKKDKERITGNYTGLRYLTTTEEAHKVQNSRERIFTRLGIQAAYCRTDFETMSLKRVLIGQIFLSAIGQRTLMKATWVHPQHQLIVMTAEPTDTAAMMGAYWMLIKLYETRGLRFEIINAEEGQKYIPGKIPRVIMVHNILPRASDERVERVRDILLRFHLSVRIVVLCNVANPYLFCVQRLGLVPHFCVRFRELPDDDGPFSLNK